VKSTKIKGIVLAGSYPWGQSLFDRLRPRPLLPIAETPLIVYALRWLSEGGVSSATICANSAARAVRGALTDPALSGMDIDFYEDWMPRGAAGCVRDAGHASDADVFVVTDGTAIPSINLQGLIETHAVCDAALTVVVHHDPTDADSAEDPGLNPGGIYVFSRRVFDCIPARGFQDIKESLIPKLHSLGERVVVHTGFGACPRVLNTETYLAVNQWMVSRLASERRARPGYAALGEAMAHESARLGANVRLVGPVVIGKDVTIGDGVTVVGPTTIGTGSVIEDNAVVSRSVVWDGCAIGPEAVLDRCLLADHAAVRAGASLFSSLRSAHSAEAPRSRRFAPGAPTSASGERLHQPAATWHEGSV
jgi:mannose-1-phosphate guanylyltransferase